MRTAIVVVCVVVAACARSREDAPTRRPALLAGQTVDSTAPAYAISGDTFDLVQVGSHQLAASGSSLPCGPVLVPLSSRLVIMNDREYYSQTIARPNCRDSIAGNSDTTGTQSYYRIRGDTVIFDEGDGDEVFEMFRGLLTADSLIQLNYPTESTDRFGRRRRGPPIVPCPGQPRTSREFEVAFDHAQAPARSALVGAFVLIGFGSDANGGAIRSCRGILNDANGKFDMVVVFEPDSIELDITGRQLHRLPLRFDSRGSLLLSLEEGGRDDSVRYGCRMTDRLTLLCVTGSGPRADFREWKRMPVRGTQRQFHQVDVP
jgi:hypothetical protein